MHSGTSSMCVSLCYEAPFVSLFCIANIYSLFPIFIPWFQIFILYFKYLFCVFLNSSYMVNMYSVLSNIYSVFQYTSFMANTFYFYF